MEKRGEPIGRVKEVLPGGRVVIQLAGTGDNKRAPEAYALAAFKNINRSLGRK